MLACDPLRHARTISVQSFCSFVRPLLIPDFNDKSTLAFIITLHKASILTLSKTSFSEFVVGKAIVFTRILLSPLLLVYNNALCKQMVPLFNTGCSWTKSSENVESALKLGNANKSFPRNKICYVKISLSKICKAKGDYVPVT